VIARRSAPWCCLRTGLAISSCATAASNHHASTTTTTVTTTSTEIKRLAQTSRYAFSLGIIGGGRRPLGCGDRTRLGVLRTAAASTTRQRSLSVAERDGRRECGIPDHGAYPSSSSAPASRRGASSARHPAPGVMDCPPSRITLAAPVIWVTASSRQAPPHNTRPWCVTLMADAFIQPVGRCHRERHRDR